MLEIVAYEMNGFECVNVEQIRWKELYMVEAHKKRSGKYTVEYTCHFMKKLVIIY